MLLSTLSVLGFAATSPASAVSPESISAGANHSCAVKTDGTPVCWGSNADGRATVSAGTGTVTQISAGGNHTCAVKTDATPVCWGSDANGQTTVPSGTGTVRQISGGLDHSCAVKTDGTPVCWGHNAHGQTTLPAGIGTVTHVSAGAGHSCAIKTDGSPVCWGHDSSGEATIPSGTGTVRQISAGSNHSCAVKTDSTPVCWGHNLHGQTTVPAGTGTVTHVSAGGNHSCAVKTDGTSVCWGFSGGGQTAIPSGTGAVTQISAGGEHNCAVKSDGTPVCWGSNGDGQTALPSGTGKLRRIQISAGFEHNCAVRTDGRPVCWGNNGHGQTTIPSGTGTVTQVSAGANHNCAVKTDGTPVCWGSNGNGQTTIPSGTGTVTQISAGAKHSCAVKTDGTPICWGYNFDGQTTIPAGTGTVTQIDAGELHSCAVKTDGTPVCWGDNSFGNGQTTIPSGTGTVTQISAGGFHSCAVKTDGTPVCWGYNLDGQTTIPGGTGAVTQIDAGAFHSCAVKTDGTPVCWGWDRYGRTTIPATVTDEAAPASSASAPATSSNPIVVGYTASDTGGSGLGKVELYVKRPGDSSYSHADTDSTPSQTGGSFTYGNAGGSYAFYTLAYDNAGNAETAPTSPDATTTLDASAPTPTLTAPANGALTNDNSPAFAGVGGTAAGDLATVTVRIWTGSSIGVGAGDYTLSASRDPSTGAYSSSGPYTHVGFGSVATLPDGTYTARAFQSDSVSNKGESTATPTFTVDTQAPTINCASPDSAWHGQNVSLACTASDSGSGLADSADASFSLSTSVADGAESSNASTGSNDVCDDAGHCTTAEPISGNKIDRRRPSTSDNVPAGVVSQNVTVTLNATDTGSGIDTTYYTKGTSPPDPTTSSAVYNPSSKPVLANSQRIKYFSTDNAGNRESVKTSPAAHAVIPPSRPTNTSPPSIPATGKVGARVSCKPGAWTGKPNSFRYSWTIDTSLIAGQHGSSYTLAAGDATHKIRCRVVARNAAGDSASATSNALTVAKPPSNCKDTVAPTSTIKIARSALEQGKLRLKGTAADKPCKNKPGRVVSVIVTISRHVKKGCRFLLENGRSFGPKRKCNGKPPIVFRAKGTKKWSLKMPVDLPAGKYTMRARATDKAGNLQAARRKGPNVLSLRVKSR